MNNKCTNYDRVKTQNIKVDGNLLIFKIPNEDLINGMVRDIYLAECVPNYTGIPQVVIQTGSQQNTVLGITNCCVPNNLYADQLTQDCHTCQVKAYETYRFIYAADTQCWAFACPVCASCGAIVNSLSRASQKTAEVVK